MSQIPSQTPLKYHQSANRIFQRYDGESAMESAGT